MIKSLTSNPKFIAVTARYATLTFITVLCGCTFRLPQFAGIRTNEHSIAAHAKVAEFDAPPESVKDLSTIRGREYSFSVQSVVQGRDRCIMAYNRREAPVSVRIIMTAEENISSDRPFPFDYLVPPNTDLCLARISAFDKDKEYRFHFSQVWMVGNYTARHTPPKGYRFPWPKGKSFTVSQAAGGPITTHLDGASQNAVDFTMPIGTPVLAARAGTVVNFEDAFTVGGMDPTLVDKANFVDVLHDDGTIATYAHLQAKSVVVQLGQAVAAGDKLGLSGSTGYTNGPHLHFAVWKLDSIYKGFTRVSIPIEFCTDGYARCSSLKYGMTVSSSKIPDEATAVAHKQRPPRSTSANQ